MSVHVLLAEKGSALSGGVYARAGHVCFPVSPSLISGCRGSKHLARSIFQPPNIILTLFVPHIIKNSSMKVGNSETPRTFRAQSFPPLESVTLSWPTLDEKSPSQSVSQSVAL